MTKTLRTVTLAGLLLALAVALGGTAAYGADVTLAWDAPTTDTDGAPLADLVGYNVRYQRAALTFSYAAGHVSGYTVGGWGPTNAVYFPARTNAPPIGLSETNKLVNLVAGFYRLWATAVSVTGESGDSNTITNKIGRPTTIWVR